MASPIFLARPVKIAGGNIRPCRILALSATKDLVVEATNSTTPVAGVALNATKYPPGSTEDNGFLQTAGFAVSYYGDGDICWVMAGAAITDFRTPLVSDGQGRAITATTITGSSAVNTFTIGYPLGAATAAGELIPVQIKLQHFPPVA